MRTDRFLGFTLGGKPTDFLRWTDKTAVCLEVGDGNRLLVYDSGEIVHRQAVVGSVIGDITLDADLGRIIVNGRCYWPHERVIIVAGADEDQVARERDDPYGSRRGVLLTTIPYQVAANQLIA